MLMMRRGAVRRVGLDRVVASCLVVASLAAGCGGAELPREAEEATAPQEAEPVPAVDSPAPSAESVVGESASEEAPASTPIPPPPPYVPDPSWPTPPEGMVYVPGGDGVFTAEGSTTPATRRVEPFFIDRTEVTVTAFTSCVREGRCDPYTVPTAGLSIEMVRAVWEWELAQCNYGREDRQDHPMNCVTWREAGRYCIANRGELPTPDQWEFAARGADAPLFWGEHVAPPEALANLRDQSQRRLFLDLANGQGNYASRAYLPFDDGYPSTAPVGVFPHDRGRFGAMDMAGNVSEWLLGVPPVLADDRSLRPFAGDGWGSSAVAGVTWGAATPGIAMGFRCVRPVQRRR
jgi:sulfatase modifying factor 1